MGYKFSLDNLAKNPKNTTKGVSDSEISRARIDSDERYTESDGWLTSAINAIDYLGNVSRSAIYGGSEDGIGGAWEYGSQAASQQRYTSPEKIKNLVGVDNVGRDDGKFQWGDLVDFGTDVATDIATDPLTYASFGLTKGAKYGLKALGKTGKGTSNIKSTEDLAKALGVTNKGDLARHANKASKLSDNLDDAAKIQRTVSTVGPPLLGGAYGAGLSDQDDSLLERLGKAGAGAVSLPLAKRFAAPSAARMLKGGKTYEFGDDPLQKLSDNLGSKIRKRDKSKGIEQLDEATFKKAKRLNKKVPDAIVKNLQTDKVKKMFRSYANPAKKIIDEKGRVKPTFIDQVKKGTDWLKGSDDAVGMFGSLSNWYVRKYGPRATKNIKGNIVPTKDPLIDNMTKTFKIAGQAAKIFQRKVDEIAAMKRKALESAGSIENQARLGQTIAQLRQFEVTKRQELWDNYLNNTWIKKKSNKKKIDNNGKYPKLGSLDYKTQKVEWKEANTISKIAQRETQKKLEELKQVEGIELYNKAVNWIETDKQFVKEINAFRRSQGLKPSQDLIGLGAHVPMFRESMKEFDQLLKLSTKTGAFSKFKTATEGTAPELIDDAVLGINTAKRQLDPEKQVEELHEAFKAYGRKTAYKFLTEEQRHAMESLSKYYTDDDHLRDMLKGYDRTMSYMKANILFGNISWLVTNYFDNLAKAYMASGVYNGFETGLMGFTQRAISKDIRGITSGNVNKEALGETADDVVEFGLGERSTMQALQSDTLENFILKAEQTAKIADGKVTNSKALKFLKGMKDNHIKILQNTTGRAGTYLETYAKAITYKHTLDGLKGSKALANRPLGELKELAAQISKDTFFDYQETIGHFEQAVMKRFLPFYSFYKLNAQFYGNMLLDPKQMGRLSKVQAGFDNIGETVDNEEMEGIPSYFKNQNPRSLGRDKFGRKYAITPGFSAYDALRSFNPEGLAFEIGDKFSPILKTAYELISGRNLFTDGELYPSNSRDGKAYLFSRGFIYKYFQDLGQAGEILDVEVDRNGNPVTTSDWLTGLDKVFQIAPPPIIFTPYYPGVSRLAGAVGKMDVGKEGAGTAVTNLISPVKNANVSRKSYWYNKRRSQREKYDERREELKKRLEEMNDN